MAIKPNRKPMKFASGAKDKQQRNAIDDAIIAAMSDDSERALSFDDTQLMKEMIGRKENLAMSTMGESGKTISDADRQRAMDRAGRLVADEFKELGMPTVKPRARPPKKPKTILRSKKISVSDEPDLPTANYLIDSMARDAAANKFATQNFEAGGAALVGGQVKLDKNKDGKISGADFRMMEDGGEAKVKKRKKSKKSKGNMCRGGGAALRGTSFSGVK